MSKPSLGVKPLTVAIAIPALAVHGVFRNRIETLVNDAVAEAEDVEPAIRDIIHKKV